MQVAERWRRPQRHLPRRRRSRLGFAVFGVLLVVGLAALGGAVAWHASAPTWTSRAAVVILPPQSGANTSNPLLRLNSGLVSLAPVLAVAIESPAAATTLREQGADEAFSIDTPSAPLVEFTVTASSPTSATRTAAALLSVARDQLDSLQSRADADGAQRATLLTVQPPTAPVRRGCGRSTITGRAAAAGGALGLVLVALVALVASLRGRRGAVPPARPSTRRLRTTAAKDSDAVVVPRTR